MSEQNVQLVRAMYDSFSRGDAPAVLGAMDPEIEWNKAENFPYADGNPYVGPTAVAEGVFARLVGEWKYWNLDIQKLLDAGSTVIARGLYDAKNKRTGKTIRAQFAHVWTLRDGKAVRFQQYADTAQVQAAMTS